MKIVGSKFAALLESANDKEIEKIKVKEQMAEARLLVMLHRLDQQILDKILQQISE